MVADARTIELMVPTAVTISFGVLRLASITPTGRPRSQFTRPLTAQARSNSPPAHCLIRL